MRTVAVALALIVFPRLIHASGAFLYIDGSPSNEFRTTKQYNDARIISEAAKKSGYRTLLASGSGNWNISGPLDNMSTYYLTDEAKAKPRGITKSPTYPPINAGGSLEDIKNFLVTVSHKKGEPLILYFSGAGIKGKNGEPQVCLFNGCYTATDLYPLIEAIPVTTPIIIYGSQSYSGILHNLSFNFKNVCSYARAGHSITVQEVKGKSISSNTSAIAASLLKHYGSNSLTRLAIEGSKDDIWNKTVSSLSSQEYIDQTLVNHNTNIYPRSQIETLSSGNQALERLLQLPIPKEFATECDDCKKNNFTELVNFSKTIQSISVNNSNIRDAIERSQKKLNDALAYWNKKSQKQRSKEEVAIVRIEVTRKMNALRTELIATLEPAITEARLIAEQRKVDDFNRIATKNEKQTLRRLLKCENFQF